MNAAIARRPAARFNSLVAQLTSDFGFQSETELMESLNIADEWAREHRLAFIGETGEENAEGFGANVGSEQCEFVRRFAVSVMAKPGALQSARNRNLIAAATALIVYSHPLLRRHVEAGQCEQD